MTRMMRLMRTRSGVRGSASWLVVMILAGGLGSLLGCGAKHAALSVEPLALDVFNTNTIPSEARFNVTATVRETGGVAVTIMRCTVEAGPATWVSPERSLRLRAHDSLVIGENGALALPPATTGTVRLRYTVEAVDDLGGRVTGTFEQTVAVHP